MTEYLEFGSANSEAGEFVQLATDDYVACRCCLLNGVLRPGLRLGSEAVEKYLKAIILYKEPGYPVIKYLHFLRKMSLKASKLEPSFNPFQDFGETIDRLELHYSLRYPKVTEFPYSASTAELARIDELVLYLYYSLPIPEVPKFRMNGYFFEVCCPWTPPLHFNPHKNWVERENATLQRVRNSLEERYRAMEKELGR